MKSIVKWIIVVALLVIFANVLNRYMNPTITDISYLASMEKDEIEARMGYEFTANEDMLRKIYAYTDGEISVEANDEHDIAIVYIDGVQAGIHTDSGEYGMFGICIGDAAINMDSKITFAHDEVFVVLDDLSQGSSTASFYYDHGTGECLVVIVNDTTNRVVALTYYTDGKKATEQLSLL